MQESRGIILPNFTVMQTDSKDSNKEKKAEFEYSKTSTLSTIKSMQLIALEDSESF